jgi:uncharacterized protein YbbK (DUF523 family)
MKENALFSLCFTGCPCRYHGIPVPSPSKIKNLGSKYNLILVCPEQISGLPTPRPAAPLRNKKGQSIKNVKGEDVSRYFVKGAEETLSIAKTFGCKKAFLCKNSPSCDASGFTGELLKENGIEVINL